jgi:hypothetical protein
MKSRHDPKIAGLLIALLLLIACNLPTLTNQSNGEPPAADNQSEQSSAADLPDFPAKGACEELSQQVAQQFPMNIYVSQETFELAPSGLGGMGCRIHTIGTGNVVTDWENQIGDLLNGLSGQGWGEDPNFSGGGAGGMLTTYRHDGIVCQLVTEVKPGDPNFCGEEALAGCLARLEPGQILYTVTIDCTPENQAEEQDGGDITVADEPETIERERVEFGPGATSATLNGSIEAAHTYGYTLTAAEGQQMIVSLKTTPPLSGLITLFGTDGTVLLTDHGDSMFWHGELPSSQDYFITVLAHSDYAIDYNLEVIIPPVGEPISFDYSPMDSADCQTLADLISQTLGVQSFITTAYFYDYKTQLSGTGCLITAWGDGVQFPDWNSSANAVMAAITGQGWVEDIMYQADGPGGHGTAYTMGNNLCIYTHITREISSALCPSDQPIGTCWATLPPELMTYTVTVNCAAP